MPIRSSTSLMDIWSKVLTTVPHLPSTILAWTSPPYHATATSWGHHLDRDGTPGRGPPARANNRVPAPTQEYARRGGDPVPRWESCQALQDGEGLQRPHPPPRSQTSWTWLVTLHLWDGCSQEPSQRSPLCTSPHPQLHLPPSLNLWEGHGERKWDANRLSLRPLPPASLVRLSLKPG